MSLKKGHVCSCITVWRQKGHVFSCKSVSLKKDTLAAPNMYRAKKKKKKKKGAGGGGGEAGARFQLQKCVAAKRAR